ncbi:MAG: ABC transporter ATP-binding protein [Gammaproteobacteria bacterium]
MTANKDVILSVRDLVTSFDTDQGRVNVLDRVSLELKRGETLGLVGESGCGKSVAALSIMRLLPKPAGLVDSGHIYYAGQDLLALKAKEMQKIRGRRIALIFQEPMTALNPVHRIGKQLGESYRIHFPDMSNEEIRASCLDILEKVGIPAPDKRLKEYPHQLSGGMRQRVMIAMALSCKPDILIADEPTTALDVTTQNQILTLMQELQKEINMSIIFITHDLGVIAETCDRVMVMYAGRVVEQAAVESLFDMPRHPYTKGLLSSIPRLETPAKSELQIIEGMVPGLHETPEGCRFRTRCPYEIEKCARINPELEKVDENINHGVACIRWREIPA